MNDGVAYMLVAIIMVIMLAIYLVVANPAIQDGLLGLMGTLTR